MINRSAFKKAASSAGTPILLPWEWNSQVLAAALGSPALAPFVDPLLVM